MTRRFKAAEAPPQPVPAPLIVFLADDYFYYACVLLNRVAEGAMLLLPDASGGDVHPPPNVGDLCDHDDQELAVLCGIAPDVWAGMNAERRIPRMVNAIKMLGTPTAGVTTRQPRKRSHLGGSAELVLLYLWDAHPVLRHVADIMEGARVAKETATQSLKELFEAGLAHRPDGPRKGTGLTERGEEIASRLAGRSRR